MLRVLHKSGSTVLDGAGYTYDDAGNRTSKTDYYASVTSNYTYDNIYQLLGVTQGGSTTESYTYDAVGNRLSSVGVSPYSYNASNQLTSTPNETYTYDANGNTATKTDNNGTTSYEWDYENRLIQATVPNVGTTSFRYDPFGRRIQKSGPLGTTNYLYAGFHLIQEVDGTGNSLARYTHSNGIDEPFALFRPGSTTYYQGDGLGSITSLTNPSATIAATYGYDTFGNLSGSTGSATNSFRYTGREFDSETSLHYYRARYYDSGTGRFVSEDPARQKAGLNFYDYVKNSPQNFADPLGLFPTSWHRNVTYNLAKQIFGLKCEAKAREIADADASVDDLNGLADWADFLTADGLTTTNGGPGGPWLKPGPHFPDETVLEIMLGNSMRLCDNHYFGRTLHSLQDAIAHGNWPPLVHFFTGPLIDLNAANGPKANQAILETSQALANYRNLCLNCCQ